jgi:penicillin-binding protein 1C
LKRTFFSYFAHPKFPSLRALFRFSKKKLVFIILLATAFLGAYFFILKDIPSTAGIGSTNYPQSTKIYDRNENLLYTIYTARNQSYVSFDKIPTHLKQATIALEDRDFYKHGAIDIRGIARAFISTVFKQELQGGSTITQQLVKNSLLTPERTITRKIKEIILSFVVESIYSKDKILEMYLNQVAYGGTAYGVQAASYVYFDKPVDRLTLEESAFLSALPEAPSVYSPFGSRPELGKTRQLQALRAMREEKYITQEQEKEAGEKELSFSKIQNKILAPHFVFYVKDLLVQKYGLRAVEQGGLNVITSLDLDLQNYAQATVAAEIDNLERLKVTNGAALITNPKSGEVLAMIGSRDYFDEEHDGNVNVVLAKRQPGSSIKPINYATGLALGYTAATPFVDDRICFPNPGKPAYCPVNYDGRFHGVVQMRFALANSYNIPAVKMLKANSVEAMIATASAMGIKTFNDPSRYGLSLTLGGGEVTMLDMAEAFGVFANNGYRIPIQPILKVTDSKGNILEEYKPPKSPIFGEKVLPDGVAYIISHILLDNGARSQAFGANSSLKVGNYPVSAKTGTTNDLRDNWTIGYTPSFVVVAWVGNNDNTPMSGVVSGVTGAAPIWHDLMEKVLEGTQPQWPQKPDNVIGKHVCADTGQVAPAEGTEGRCPTRFEYFIRGMEDSHGKISREKVFIDKGTGAMAKSGQTENIEEQEKTVIIDLNGDKYCVDCAHPELAAPTPNP